MHASNSKSRQNSVQGEGEKRRALAILALLKKLHPQAVCALYWRTPWELLVGVILSAQCTDARVNKVTKILFEKYPTLDAFAHACEGEIARSIFSVGTYRVKAHYLCASARRIALVYGGEVPNTLEALLTLEGVGRKTALVVLGNAFGVSLGIPVDTHVFRFAHRYGLSAGHTPEQVERDLCVLLPKKEWHAFALRAIAHGRTFSPARGYSVEKDPLGKYALL